MSIHDGTRLGDLVPSATTDLRQFLAMPDVGSIRNPRLVRAMLVLLAKCPRITIHPNTPVTGLLLDSGSVTGVRTQARDYAADAIVLCSGAWTSALLADIDACPPIKPVRGQMVAFQAATGLLETILLRDGTYLIPRRGGVVLAGSTLEFVGFDKTTTQSARDWLVSRAIGMCPRLAEAELIAHWAGLRPGSPEGIPWIGPWPGTKGLFLNAGHYRNGLVLAPAASRLLADLLLERPLSVSADSCLPASRLRAARVSPDLEWTTQSS